MKTIITKSDIDTRFLASEIANKTPLGSVILLTGDLGAGKTTFVKGFAEAIGIKEKVNSPTFNIMKLYFGEKSLIHIDAYRLESLDSNIGLDEYIGYEKGYTFIEWPDFIKDLIPEDHIKINIKNIGDNNREITVEGVDL
jgi:tRNA threonylcarbamoyladenosine biosynthesis protein TsaE